MILLTILVLLAVFLLAGGILLISAGGALFTVLFGDVLVCVAVIAFVIYKLVKKKKRK